MENRIAGAKMTHYYCPPKKSSDSSDETHNHRHDRPTDMPMVVSFSAAFRGEYGEKYVSERVKSFNEQIYYLVDNINTAINHGKQISFRYFHFDQHRKEVPNNGGKRSGQLKAQTPVPLKRFISSVKHKSSPISAQAEALAQERI